MILPQAPAQYNQRDQDELRGALNRAMSSLTLDTVPDGSTRTLRELVQVVDANATTVTTTATGETDHIVETLPAGTLAANGDIVHIVAWGTGIVTGSGVWQVRLYFGSTIIGQFSGSGVATENWKVEAWVARTGASAQKATSQAFRGNSGVDHRQTTPAETLANAVTIKTTGANSSGLGTISVSTQALIIQRCLN